MLKILHGFICLIIINLNLTIELKANENQWFDEIKASSDKTELYRLLYFMPKGGDLHNHLSGAGFSEWWYEIALSQQSRGYIYYTRIQQLNCETSKNRAIIDFRNISNIEFEHLKPCVQKQYKKLSVLTDGEKTQWLNSLRLDKPNEGREEFFERHWQRLHALYANPWIKAELLYKNMQAFAKEGLVYLEFQISLNGFVKADGSEFPEDDVADVYRRRLNQQDAKKTGITVRFQSDLLRFLPGAEKRLVFNYQFVDANPDLWVGINMVGREDHPNGQPKRFMATMKKMKKKYPDIKASIHAGESEERNFNVRDTLMMGADRIGHGVNLIYDKKTMQSMEHSRHLIEINLISNLLLEYVDDYASHPFPTYLRSGIPVTLSTDDRGMWDSTMTDEYFVATTEFDLSWQEIKLLITNSIQYGFMDEQIKSKMLSELITRLESFEKQLKEKGLASLGLMPETRGFICRNYKLCNQSLH
ncbi:MAG: adenosine deaminase [Gammaproteobacteria bacterium]|nr:adenosine deaminase [Gammaproteobacteria bacterium]